MNYEALEDAGTSSDRWGAFVVLDEASLWLLELEWNWLAMTSRLSYVAYIVS